MPVRRFLLLAAALLLAACAGIPGPGDPGYPYNVDGTYGGRLTVDSVAYEAVVRMETAADGTVSGSLGGARLGGREGDSATLEGDFSGTVEGDSLIWRSSWVVSTSGCSGVFRGRGPVARGGAEIEGELRAAGSCVESARGSFRLER